MPGPVQRDRNSSIAAGSSDWPGDSRTHPGSEQHRTAALQVRQGRVVGLAVDEPEQAQSHLVRVVVWPAGRGLEEVEG